MRVPYLFIYLNQGNIWSAAYIPFGFFWFFFWINTNHTVTCKISFLPVSIFYHEIAQPVSVSLWFWISEQVNRCEHALQVIYFTWRIFLHGVCFVIFGVSHGVDSFKKHYPSRFICSVTLQRVVLVIHTITLFSPLHFSFHSQAFWRRGWSRPGMKCF